MCARSCIIVCVCAHVKRVCVAEARNDSHESWVRVFHYFINLYYSPARGGGGGHTTSYKIYIIQHHNTAGCVRVIYDLFFIYNEDIIGGQGRGAEEERTDPPVHVCIMYIRYTSSILYAMWYITASHPVGTVVFQSISLTHTCYFTRAHDCTNASTHARERKHTQASARTAGISLLETTLGALCCSHPIICLRISSYTR